MLQTEVVQSAEGSLSESTKASREEHLQSFSGCALVLNKGLGFVMLPLPQMHFCIEGVTPVEVRSSLFPLTRQCLKVSLLGVRQLHHK